MNIGKKLYFDNAGNFLAEIGERTGEVVETTFEQDCRSKPILAEYAPDSLICIQLEFGQFAEEFKRYDYRLDPDTRQLVWNTKVDRTVASLDDVKASKIDQLDYFCNKAITSGFTSSALGEEHTYPSDPEAQNNLQIVLRRLEIGEEQAAAGFGEAVLTYPFQTLDAGYLDHSLKQLKQVFADGVDALGKHVMYFRELKAQVEAASTAEEVDDIQW